MSFEAEVTAAVVWICISVVSTCVGACCVCVLVNLECSYELEDADYEEGRLAIAVLTDRTEKAKKEHAEFCRDNRRKIWLGRKMRTDWGAAFFWTCGGACALGVGGALFAIFRAAGVI